MILFLAEYRQGLNVNTLNSLGAIINNTRPAVYPAHVQNLPALFLDLFLFFIRFCASLHDIYYLKFS